VDASLAIGTGHVARCLVLAKMLSSNNVDVTFICRAHDGHMGSTIESEGFKVILLPLNQPAKTAHASSIASMPYEDWLGASWFEDAADTLNIARNFSPSWVIVDHYGIDEKWEGILIKGCGGKVMAIDGQANRRHNCHLLLDPTFSLIGFHRWDDLVPSHCERLVGLRYALFREEFHKVKQARIGKGSKLDVKKILITFGGTDVNNLTQLALDAAKHIGKSERLEIHLLIGQGNPNLHGYRASETGDVQVHVQPESVAELMAQADIAITAGGGTLIELLYLSVPCLVITTAKNQVRMCNDLEKIGAVKYVGNYVSPKREELSSHLKSALLNFIEHKNLSQMLAAKSSELFLDGTSWIEGSQLLS
jgi:UDP-2,4-diacetamido-2,4,6-trideoxy-beta-L-altropyranose hydrolase